MSIARAKQRMSHRSKFLRRLAKKRIGTGTNSQILIAYPVGFAMEPFALKLMKSVDANLPHEVDAMRACQNIPFVVDCLDVIDDGKYTYLPMPHYDRSFMDAVMKDGMMSVDQVQDIMTEVLQTLIGCHEQGVAHLDVKPDNLMEDSDGNTILIDFGSSHKFDSVELFQNDDEDYCLLDTRAECGTEQFAAPELADNQFSPTKSDMWGAAATAVSLITAEFPEKGVTLLEEFVEADTPLHHVITQGMHVDQPERISPPEALSVLSEG